MPGRSISRVLAGFSLLTPLNLASSTSLPQVMFSSTPMRRRIISTSSARAAETPRGSSYLWMRPPSRLLVTLYEFVIRGKRIIIDQLKRRLEAAALLKDQEDAAAERDASRIFDESDDEGLSKPFRACLSMERGTRKDEKRRVIDHVVLSPPINVNHGGRWALRRTGPSSEIYSSLIPKTNFRRQRYRPCLRRTFDELNDVDVIPTPVNPTLFQVPPAIACFETVPDEEGYVSSPGPKAKEPRQRLPSL